LLTSSNHLSLREVCDGLLGSQSRGVPGMVRNRWSKELKALQPYTPYLPVPGLSTWLERFLFLSTNSIIISKLLFQVSQLMIVKNVIITASASEGKSFLLDKLKMYFKSKKGLGSPAHLLEITLISKFFASLPQNLTFILCGDRYLFELIRFVSSELSVLTDVIPDFTKRFDFTEQSKLLLNTCSFPRSSFVKFVKYHTACPMAYILKESLPPKPLGFPGHFLLWTGSIKRVLKNILNRRNFQSDNSLSLKLSLGFLQGIKRGCATVSDSFLRDELVSHVISMTTVPTFVPHKLWIDKNTRLPLSEVAFTPDQRFYTDASTYVPLQVTVDVIRQTFESCLKAVVRPPKPKTAEQAFSSWNPSLGTFRDSLKPSFFLNQAFEPSHNACFENPRGEGGAYECLVQSQGLRLIESEPLLVKGKFVTNEAYELPNVDLMLSQVRLKASTSCLEALKDEVGDLRFWGDASFLPDFDRLIDESKMKTGVIPLSEPLKVRVITKSEAVPAYLAKALQKRMKAFINRFPAFVLTTRPLLVSDFRQVWKLEKTIEDYFGIKLDFTDHVSGDYKAATDKLNINFTKLVFERFLDALNVPQEDRDVYRSVLYEQRLFYPKRYSTFLRKSEVGSLDKTPDGDLFSIDQVNGQLMGSILSFPVLCLANLICYKCALDEYINLGNTGPRRHVNVFSLPCLINGDDIYFRSNPVFYKIWLKFITIAGFHLSVGKNYVHPSVFTINSQCFTYVNESDTIRETTYLNVGLLIGQSKSGVVGEKLPVWDLYNKVLAGSYNKLEAHKRFLYYHRDSIAQVTKKGNYNLFLPKLLGGLGFVRPSLDIPVKITPFQRQLATFFHNKITSAYHKPVLSLSISKARIIDEALPKVYETYQGEPIIMSVKIGEPIPMGFTLQSQIVDKPLLMCHQFELGHMEPKLAFRSITSSDLKEFRSSTARSFKGETCWFGLEAAEKGLYPYVFAQSDTFDQASFEENEKLVISKTIISDVVEGVLDSVSGDLIDHLF